ncbi:MAG TPA: molybdopterin cofactor-binding domain-containing protein [Dehalococcoidia bacterium]|nr:molybdopterin cofactor-binding domain-containing protein [Dehalococcoidia bacterium]
MARELSVVGKSRPKIDAPAKVTGQARYTDDLTLPRMLCGKLLRSTQTHALIKSIDTSEALNLPGVHAVITGVDLPVKYSPFPITRDETALATDRVRYVGEAVAAVAAVDEETAERALRLIQVEYEPLPIAMSIEEALKPGAPALHERGNAHRAHSLEFGDVEEGFRQADHVREDVFFYQGSNHLAIEPHAALAQYEPVPGKLTVWTSTQSPHQVRRLLSLILEFPPQRIRVIAPTVGGGFGGKMEAFSHESCAAKLAIITGRPVKITLTREEVFYTHRGRHPVLTWVKTGVKRDGTITAVHIRSILDGGGYIGQGAITTYYASGNLLPLTYRIPRYKFEGVRVYTNKPVCGPKRGMGNPQARCALEVQIDKIAHDLGLDPVEMRLRQLTSPNSLTINYLCITSNGLRECVERAVEASGWREKHGRLPYGQGIGFACAALVSGSSAPLWQDESDMPLASVHIQVDRLGTVTISSGATDIGQGSDTMLAMVVAEVLGLEPGEMRVVTADTETTPVDLGAFSSRITFMVGNAALDAAERIARVLCRAAAAKLGVAEGALALGGGRVRDRENPEVSVSFMEAARLAEAAYGPLSAIGSYSAPPPVGTYRGAGMGASPAYGFSACVAQVAVSPRTGEVKVEKIWLADDCGRAINPILVEGQAEGSVYMGLGEALMEEQAFISFAARPGLRPFPKGVHRSPSMLDYKSPTAVDMPDVKVFHVESIDPEGPFGAKESGEGPIMAVMPAIVNAVYDALGIRIDEVPVTPEKVLKALEEKEKGNQPRYGPGSFPKVTFPESRQVEPPPQ